MALNLLLNTQIICIIFIKALKKTIQMKNVTYQLLFDDTNADMLSSKKPNSAVTELFIIGRKLNISLVFITQSYFKVPKHVRLNTKNGLLQKPQTKENFNKLRIIIH